MARWTAAAMAGGMFIGLVAATAWVVASDLVRKALDKADPVAAFAEELQTEVDAELARVEWLRDRPDFARWDQQVWPS